MVIQTKDTANYPTVTPDELMGLFPIVEAANEADPEMSGSLFVHGNPGGAKTEMPRLHCQITGQKHIKFVAPLTGIEALQGFPKITEEEGIAKVKMAMLDILPTEEGPGWIVIDELPQAFPIQQAAFAGIIYGGDLMHWKRPPGWNVYVTGNLMANKAATYRVPGQINNRVSHVILKQHIDAFTKWALTREDRGGFDPVLLSWLRRNPEYLDGYDPELEASPTGRTLHMASGYERQTKFDQHLRDILAEGCIGTQAFASFAEHRTRKLNFPTRPEILKDPEGCRLVTDPSAAHGMMNALAGGLNAEQAPRIITYVLRYQRDHVAVFVAEVRENATTALKSAPAVRDLLQKFPE
jgi:hypothetical protein